MPEANVYLITQKITLGEVIHDLDYYSRQLIGYATRDYDIFAPGHFVLGPVKKTKNGFQLTEGTKYCFYDAEYLERCQKEFDEGAFKIVQSMHISESDLECVVNEYDTHFQGLSNLFETVNSRLEGI